MGGKLLQREAHVATRADARPERKGAAPTAHGEDGAVRGGSQTAHGEDGAVRGGSQTAQPAGGSTRGAAPVTRWFDFARRVWARIERDHVSLAAAGVAFYALLALFPAIIALVTGYALVADPAQVRRQLDPVVAILPADAASLLVRQLTAAVEANPGGLTFGLVVSLLTAVWAAAGGMNALITGLNIVYGVPERRGFVRLRALAAGLTVGAMVTMVVALALVAAFPVALRWVGLDPVAEIGAQGVRWLLLVVLVGLGLGVVYRWAPDRPGARWRWFSAGAAVALVVWLAASVGLSLYVSHFGSYNKTYGSLAAVVVLLLWLYLSAFAILLGAEIEVVGDRDAPAPSSAHMARNTGVYSASPSGTPDITTQEGATMSTVVETVEVAVPVQTAYNQWTQFEEFPRFMEGVQEVRQVDDTHLHWVIDIAGVHREFDAEITEQLPDQRIAWESVAGPRHAGVVTFHPLDSAHSRVTAQMDIDPEGFVENVADKTGIIDRRVKGDMKRFRDFIEGRGHETGAWRGEV